MPLVASVEATSIITSASPSTAAHVASGNGVTIQVVPKAAPTGPGASVEKIDATLAIGFHAPLLSVKVWATDDEALAPEQVGEGTGGEAADVELL